MRGPGATERTARAHTPFVGRVPELATVVGQVEQARAASPAVVVVEGPPGMGKTTLVQRVFEGAPDLQVMTAAAEEWEARLPGGVATQLLAAADEPRDPLRPRLAEAALDPYALGVELLEVLGRRQEQGPVAVVVDDAQWADTLSVQGLAFALRRLRTDQVVAVFAARDGSPGLPDGLRRLAGGERGVSLRLGGLTPAELSELATAVTGRPLSRRAAEHLRAHTGGNPLHARALLEELGEEGLEGAGTILPAPRSFATVVVDRLAGCSPDTVNLVQAAAVMGQRSPLSAATAVAGVADPAAALDEAVAAQLLELCPPRQVAFVHPLVRAAVYHDLGPSRRSALHARAAAALDGPPALFHRVEAALVEDADLAAEVEAQGREELTRGALAAGADALLAAARLTTDRSARPRLVLDALEALLAAGEVAQAAAVADEVARLPVSARSRCLLGRLALAGGRQHEAEGFLREAWRLCEHEQPGAALAALVAADLAQVCAMQLRSEEAAEWARRSIDASPDPELATSALSILVPCLGRIGRHVDAVGVAASGLDDGSAPSARTEALLGRGIVRLWVDDLEQARADLAEVVDACRDRPASRQALVALGMLADTEYRIGAWDDSVVHAAQVVSLVEDSEQVWFGAFAHSVATRALAPRGDFDRAEHHAAQATKAGRVLGDATSLGCAATAAAHVAFFRGDPAGAVRAVQPMLELGTRADDDEPSVHPWRELHIEALVRLGRLDEAEAALQGLEALASARDRRSSLVNAARLRGGLEAARGRTSVARARFEAAVDQAHGLGAPFELARAQNDYGSFLRRLGERRAAATQLQAASERFTALGAAPLVERCRQELAACGSARAPRAERAATDLTPQELAVARLVAAGQSNREVAADLIVSPKTVEYHLSHVYAKLGVRSRTQLVARLAATGRLGGGRPED